MSVWKPVRHGEIVGKLCTNYARTIGLEMPSSAQSAFIESIKRAHLRDLMLMEAD